MALCRGYPEAKIKAQAASRRQWADAGGVMAYSKAASAFRAYFLNGRCWILIAALIIALGATVSSIRAQSIGGVLDVNDVGNEAVPLLEGMASFLNTHTCITEDELAAFTRAVNAMQQRLDNEEQDVDTSSRHNTGENLNVTPAGWERARTRISNYKRELTGHLRDLESMPRCSPPAGGLRVGAFIIKSWGHLRSTERLAATGDVTNQFSDTNDPIGGGLVIGYDFRLWGNSVVVGPFASFDWLHQSVNHTFANGSFLGTTSHWSTTVGARAGFAPTSSLLIYGLAGASWLNQDLNINFGGPVTSQNKTTPGFTLGAGVEYQPDMLKSLPLPVSVFLQYQHSWWADAHLDTPAASPLFNYTFRRDDDTFKLGVVVRFAGRPPARVTSRRLVTK